MQPPAGDVAATALLDAERLALAMDAGRLGTWQWTIGTGELVWDASLERVFGIPTGSFAGTLEAYLALVHPEDRARTGEIIQRSVAAGGDYYVEHRVPQRDGSLRWVAGHGRLVRDATGAPSVMVGVGVDVTDRKLAETRLEFLSRAGALLGSSLDLDTTLQQLCDLAIEQLADWCSVDLLEPDGVRLVAVAHRDPAKVAWARELRERFGVDMDADQGLPAVLRSGEPEVYPELGDEMIRAALAEVPDVTDEDLERFLALGLRSSMTVPLTTGTGAVVGALSVVSAESGRTYGEADVTLALEIARRAGVAVDNARLYSRVEHAATTLQQSLLPPVLPSLGFAELAAYYAPLGSEHELIGGDFYDVFPLAGGRWCLVLGDVAGKGVDAAALTAAARWTLRSSLARAESPGEALEELNAALAEQSWAERFVTVFAAVVHRDGEGVAVSYASGGHPGPIVRRADGRTELLPVDGQILGILPRVTVRSLHARLEPGDALVLYSDGLPDAIVDGRPLGEQGMQAALAGAAGSSAGDVVAALVAAIGGTGARRDDVALLALAVPPA